MNETLNALCVLMALIGVAAITAGWLIVTFSRLFRKCWLDALLCVLLLPAPIIAWRRQQRHALWMLLVGSLLLIAGFGGSMLLHSQV